MKILQLFIFLAVMFTVSSCSKEDKATFVVVTVIDGKTGQPAPGATVALFTLSGNDTLRTTVNPQLTNASGVASIPVPFVFRYYVVAQTNTEKNYYGQGYIPIGYFKSQADIDNSPIQTPTPVVGGIKFQDTNGDGKIDASDIQQPPAVQLTMGAKNPITVTMY